MGGVDIPDFVAIDFEKMNDNPTSACEVAMVKYERGVEVERMCRLIRPKRGLVWSPRNRAMLQHIDGERLKEAYTFEELHPRMVDFIGESLLVCHKAGADMNYLFYLEREADVARSLCRNGYADTEEVARKRHIGVTSGLNHVCMALLMRQHTEHHQADADARACGDIFVKMCQSFDYSTYIHSAPYRPKIDKEWDKKDFTGGVSIDELGKDIKVSDLTFEDELLPSFDFLEQKTVITGMGEATKSNLRLYAIPKLGAIDQHDNVNSRTNVLVVGEKSPGWRKLLNALEQKSIRPNSFHVFSGKAFLEELYNRGVMERPAALSQTSSRSAYSTTGGDWADTGSTDSFWQYEEQDEGYGESEHPQKNGGINWSAIGATTLAILELLGKALFFVGTIALTVVFWLCGIPVKRIR